MLPEGWKKTTVGKCCSIKNNIRTPINETDRNKIQGIYPYYGPTGILGYINKYKIDEDFSLIGEDGDHFLKYKDKEMTIFYSGKACINNHAHVICNSEKCLAKWFYLYFLHKDITKYITRQGAKRFKLNKNSLETISIILPPLIEQEKIAAVLSTWDKAISTADAMLENSRRQKKALMQQLLTGKRRLPGFRGEWKIFQLRQRTAITKGTQINKNTLSSSGDYPVMNGGILPSGYFNLFNSPANSIIISEGGNSCGFVQYMKTCFWCGGDCYKLEIKYDYDRYIYHYLKFFEKKIMALRVGSGLPNIQKERLASFGIKVPPSTSNAPLPPYWMRRTGK